MMEQNDKCPTVSISSLLIHSTKRNANSVLGHNSLKAVNKVHGMIPMKQRVHGDNIERCKIVKNKWFAYNPMRVNVGSICQWKEESDCIVSPDYVVFKCDEIKLAPDYMFQLIKSSIWNNYVKRAGAGSVRVRIYFKDLSPLKILLPPLPEQKKIASIFTTLDDKISSIENQIQQTEQLKKGLMEKLLTEGIGHTEFKDTKIGRMPKDWDVVSFGDIVELNKRKINPKDNGNHKCIELEHIEQGTGRLLGYSLTNGKSSSKTPFKPGDILFGKLRPYLMKYILPDFDGVCSTEIFVFSSKSFVDNRFAFNIVRTDGFIANSVSKSFGTKMPRTNWKIVSDYSLPFPPLEEQKQIASILSTVDDKIELLNQKKSQYQALKKGLSQQLLTGQMRVAVKY